MHINVFAKSDETPSLPVQVIKEKAKCCSLRITKGNNSKELARSPYFSIITVHLVDINVFAKFYEIPSLPFQDIEKPKRLGRRDGLTDRLMWKQYTPTLPHKHSLLGGIIICLKSKSNVLLKDIAEAKPSDWPVNNFAQIQSLRFWILLYPCKFPIQNYYIFGVNLLFQNFCCTC